MVVSELNCSSCVTTSTGRLNWGYHLVEPPVLDSLSTLSRIPNRRDLMVVGGTALSLYCYEKFPTGIRETDDVDVSSREYLTRSQFNAGIGLEIYHILEKMGYQPNIMRSHKDFTVRVVEQTELNDAFYICVSRRSRKYREIVEKRILREFENAVELNVPETENKVFVARFEDVLAPKIQMMREKDVRDIKAVLKFGPEPDMKYLEDALVIWSGGSELTANEHLEKFKRIKTEAK